MNQKISDWSNAREYIKSFNFKMDSRDLPDLDENALLIIDIFSQYEVILDRLQNKVPEELRNQFYGQRDEFYSLVITNPTLYDSREVIKKIHVYIQQFFDNIPNNKYYGIFKAVDVHKPIESLNYESEINRWHTLNNDAQKLIKVLQESSTNLVVSNYAEIFSKEEKDRKRDGTIWLITSITLSFITVVLIIIQIFTDLFNVKKINPQSQQIEIIYPNLFNKILFFSLLIYLVAFCFKQYNIRKNLEALNRHRKNAINSYLLFAQSISDDVSSKNNLMLYVCKYPIYQTDLN